MNVRFTNGQRSEGRSFRLTKEDEDRIQFVLVGDEEKDGDGEGNEQLRGRVRKPARL